jgi:signal transduction histidine kinase
VTADILGTVLLAASEAEVRALRAELDETNRGLLALYGELQDAHQRIADLVAMLSHDIRQPLGVITTFCELLLDEETGLSGDQRRLIERIAAAGGGMTQLVEEILTLAQLDADGLGARPAPVDVGQAMAEAVAAVPGMDQAAVDVQVVAGCVALADPRHLHQILTNLLSNAVKYGAPPMELRGRTGPATVEITVRDHGDGVPADFVPRLFDRFTRADTPACRARKGTGLGLYIVRQLAEANRGTVAYGDHPDGGGCFTVLLPQPSAPP